MTITNHEYYVSLEVAKLLKEGGFEWEEHYPRNFCYVNDNTELFDKSMLKNYIGEDDVIYLAPTLDVAQRWLREVNDIDIYIFPTTNNKRGCVYEWEIKTFGRALWVEGQPYTNQYETYEEALEAGIKKAIEIILKK